MPRAGPRAVGDVDRRRRRARRSVRLLATVEAEIVAARRHQFDARDPLPVGQPPASRDFSANGAAGFRRPARAPASPPDVRRRLSGLIGRAISRICSGVVPQQPPTADAPRSTKRLAYVGQVFGRAEVDAAVIDFLGHAGVGLHDQRQRVRRTARSTAPSSPSGPLPQFMPQATGGGSRRASGASIRSTGSPAADSPARPSRRRARRARRAAAAWPRRSAPGRPGGLRLEDDEIGPAFHQTRSTCSAIICLDARLVLRLRRASGPIEPATNTGRSGRVGHLAGPAGPRRR